MNKKLLRKKLALMLANLKKKRPFYTEIEFIESTGTQYIDTGLLSTANSKVDIVYGFTSMESGAANNCAIFGGRNSSTTNTFTFFKIASTTPQFFRFDYNSQTAVGNATQLTWNAASKYRFSYNGSIAKTENITTGESYSANISPGSTYSTSTIVLFAENTNGNVSQFMKGRIYKYWYTDGTNTIDLIPVLDWNGVACMYDKISGQLFYNQGSGSFTAGREIHPVEYLEGTGTQYIDTGVIFNESVSYSWEIYGQVLNAGNTDYTWFIGTQTPWTMAGTYNDGSQYTFYPVGTYYQNGQVVTNTSGEKYSPVKHVLTQTGNSSNTLSLTLFARHNNNDGKSMSGTKRVFSCKISKAGNSIRDFIPAIDENGVGYMFDQVSHTIYDNAGTGAFAYPAREVDYLESTGTQWLKTDYTLTANTKIDVLFSPNQQASANLWVIGSFVASNKLTGVRITGDTTIDCYINTVISKTVSGSNIGNKYQAVLDGKWTVNDVQGTSITPSAGLSPLVLFGWNASTTANTYAISGLCLTKIYYCKIWDNGTPVRDFIPCYKDGQAGMLDKVNNVFYPNAGTGTFTAGKIVESEYE